MRDSYMIELIRFFSGVKIGFFPVMKTSFPVILDKSWMEFIS